VIELNSVGLAANLCSIIDDLGCPIGKSLVILGLLLIQKEGPEGFERKTFRK
jgi:hypothetical protein